MSAFFAALAGFAAGIVSGFGIGGGTLLIIYLTAFAGFSQLSAQGINLFYFIPTASAALYSHFKNRLVDLEAALICAGAGVLSAVPAAFLASVIDAGMLKRLFGVCIIYAGLNELFKKRPEAEGGKQSGAKRHMRGV